MIEFKLKSTLIEKGDNIKIMKNKELPRDAILLRIFKTP